MRFTNLRDWLSWLEGLHPRKIDLSLERVAQVAGRLALGAPAPTVITVAGTNGKGSSVAMLEAILGAQGYRIGAYTSPHLLRYNERVRIAGEEASDARLCDAFAQVDEARGEITLTYFEFGTLAALLLFCSTCLDAAVLEVGLGGRLDAVNIVDPDIALVTTIGVDHVDWLGPDRESIAREKAGIFRAQRPAIYNDQDPPQSLLRRATELGASLSRLGMAYRYAPGTGGWSWQGCRWSFDALPLPALPGDFQLKNAAGALAVLELIGDRLPVSESAISRGLSRVNLPGRFQVLPGPIERILDVAHNPQAAHALASTLKAHPCGGRTLAVFSILKDKDITGVVQELAEVVDAWHVADLATERATALTLLAAEVRAQVAAPVLAHEAGIAAAYRTAMAQARPGDRVLVFGSFHTVADVLALDL
jgi:dihydrofolate synthase / folylpolyglutamate synthase